MKGVAGPMALVCCRPPFRDASPAGGHPSPPPPLQPQGGNPRGLHSLNRSQTITEGLRPDSGRSLGMAEGFGFDSQAASGFAGHSVNLPTVYEQVGVVKSEP